MVAAVAGVVALNKVVELRLPPRVAQSVKNKSSPGERFAWSHHLTSTSRNPFFRDGGHLVCAPRGGGRHWGPHNSGPSASHRGGGGLVLLLQPHYLPLFGVVLRAPPRAHGFFSACGPTW